MLDEWTEVVKQRKTVGITPASRIQSYEESFPPLPPSTFSPPPRPSTPPPSKASKRILSYPQKSPYKKTGKNESLHTFAGKGRFIAEWSKGGREGVKTGGVGAIDDVGISSPTLGEGMECEGEGDEGR